MRPVDFVGSNQTFKAPPGSESWCDDLHVQKHDGGLTSMWLPDAEELARLNAGQPVQLTMCSAQHPPVFVTVARPADVAKDPNRCAACGWPLAGTVSSGCHRGDCSQRPLPKPEAMYDADRYSKEQHR